MLFVRAACAMTLALAIATAPAAAQDTPTNFEEQSIGDWALAYSEFETGVRLCTVVADTEIANSFAFTFAGGNEDLYIAFRPAADAGLTTGNDVSFNVAFDAGGALQPSSGSLQGFVAASEDGQQIVFVIDPRATELFKSADAVVFDYAGGYTTRFDLAGSRRALDALEECARERL